MLSELASESTVRGLMRQDSVHTVPDHLRPQEELLACEDTEHTDEIEADQAAKSSECTEEAGSAQDVKPSREFPTAQVLQAASPSTTSQPEKRQADSQIEEERNPFWRATASDRLCKLLRLYFCFASVPLFLSAFPFCFMVTCGSGRHAVSLPQSTRCSVHGMWPELPSRFGSRRSGNRFATGVADLGPAKNWTALFGWWASGLLQRGLHLITPILGALCRHLQTYLPCPHSLPFAALF